VIYAIAPLLHLLRGPHADLYQSWGLQLASKEHEGMRSTFPLGSFICMFDNELRAGQGNLRNILKRILTTLFKVER
jgi:hypothetical protein